MKKPQFTHNIYIALLLRLGIVLGIYTVLRLLFYVLNQAYFQNLSAGELAKILFFGIRFDASAIMFINLLFIFLCILPFNFRSNKYYRLFTEIIFYITNAAGIMLNCVDLVFFRFIFRRTTFDVVKGSIIGDDLSTMFWHYLFSYWYVVLIALFLIAALIFLYRKTRHIQFVKITTLKQFLLNTLWFVLLGASSIIIARGGFQLRPLSLINAGQYTQPQNLPLIVNTPFSIFSTIQMQSITNRNYFAEAEARKIFNPIIQNKILAGQSFRKLNVVVIIVESLSKEYIGALNPDLDNGNYKGYTPFLDSLIGKSLAMHAAFANGKRSIEGIPAVVSGLPSLMNDAYITSVFSGNKINSFPTLLKPQGYTSAFYHGGKNGTMNFDAYARLAGFDNYYGKNEYNNDADYDGEWGIYDEQFLQYTANKMNKTKQPFFATLFTLSSHHPYTIPAKYKNKFNKGTLEIHESIGYTDYALRRFFQTCSQMSWFDSTLFVITADHSSLAQNQYYETNLGIYSIPIIYYMHGNTALEGMPTTITQQTDILPSVLDYLHYNQKYVAFGTSIFDTTSQHFAISYLNNSYQLIKDDYLLQFDGEKATGLFNFHDDRLLKNNLLQADTKLATELSRFAKALIQEYDQRMIQNKLTDCNE
ncbi:MAG: sulfatase-like hydrolase/transferase [Bacteroidota bacterium]